MIINIFKIDLSLLSMLAIAILCFACNDVDSNSPKLLKYRVAKDTIITGLNHPWSISFLEEDIALITEKDGGLLKVDLLNNTKTPILGFPSDLKDSLRIVHRGDNSGIFEIVKHPDFSSNQLIYVSYAAKNSDGYTTKIIRARLKEDELIDLTTIFIADPYTKDLFHYGGGMIFGLDGKLYFTIGERLYNEKDQPSLPIAQDVTDKRGKIYRLNDDGSMPDDNPDFGKDAIPGLYAMGIRAAQGITVDKIDGTIWFSEHGTYQGDELNLLKAGANYGWPIKTTGKYRFKEYDPPAMEGTEFSPPIHYWKQTIAPTGLIVYNDEEFEEWKGDLILPGLSNGSLWRINLENKQVESVEELFVNDRTRSRKVAVSPEGKLFMLTDEDDGKLIRIFKKD